MLFGKVFGAHGTICRIQVFCEVKKENETLLFISSDVESVVGSTKAVFVPNNNWNKLHDDELVFFSIKKNQREREREDDDIFLLDEKFNDLKALPILKSNRDSAEKISSEPFYNNHFNSGTAVYVKQDKNVIGLFKIKNELGTTSLEVSPRGNTNVRVWHIEDLNIFNAEKFGLYLIGKPDNKKAKQIDISTPLQLKKWFHKKIQKHGNGEYLNAIKELEPFIKNSDSYSNDELEKQKWEKIRDVVDRLQFEYEEIREILLFPSIINQVKNELDQYKDEYIENKQAELNAELELFKQEVTDQKKDIELKLNSSSENALKKIESLEKSIELKKKELVKITSTIDQEKQSIGVLEPILEKFSKNREDIIQQTTILQSILGNFPSSLANINTTSLPDFSSFKTDSINFEDKQFYKAASRILKDNDYDVSASKVRLMQVALESCKGLFVPDLEWSRCYCDAHPNYHHFSIVVDPSLKNITDLWEQYLEDIALVAESEPDQKFYVHFDGVNNSVPDVWMKALQNLVQFEKVRVPVKGLPLWPENIYFFFSPANHKNTFELTKTTLGYFPSIHHKELEGDTVVLEGKQNNFQKLKKAISQKTGKEIDECEEDAKELAFGYSELYLNEV